MPLCNLRSKKLAQCHQWKYLKVPKFQDASSKGFLWRGEKLPGGLCGLVHCFIYWTVRTVTVLILRQCSSVHHRESVYVRRWISRVWRRTAGLACRFSSLCGLCLSRSPARSAVRRWRVASVTGVGWGVIRPPQSSQIFLSIPRHFMLVCKDFNLSRHAWGWDKNVAISVLG